MLVGFPVYNYTGQMWKKKENETFNGGHAMTIVDITTKVLSLEIVGENSGIIPVIQFIITMTGAFIGKYGHALTKMI